MNASELQSEIETILERDRLPASVRDAAQHVLVRMNSTIGVAIYDPERILVSPLLGAEITADETLISLNSQDFEDEASLGASKELLLDFHFHVCNASHDFEHFLSSSNIADCELLIWCGNGDFTVMPNAGACFDPARRIAVTESAKSKARQFAGEFRNVIDLTDLETLSKLMLDLIRHGREADQNTAYLLLRKYGVKGARKTTSDNGEEIWRRLSDALAGKTSTFDPLDNADAFTFCTDILAQWDMMLAGATKTDVDARHYRLDVSSAIDRATLLSLENTDDAAVEALMMIHQLKRDFELRCA